MDGDKFLVYCIGLSSAQQYTQIANLNLFYMSDKNISRHTMGDSHLFSLT